MSCPKGLGSPKLRARRPFYYSMKELSIFIDEAGVLGPCNKNDPYYLVSFVFHNQSNDITNEILECDRKFNSFNLKIKSFHAGPIIRREGDYKLIDREIRKKLYMNMITFVRHLPIKIVTFYVEKKQYDSSDKIIGRLSVEISRFLLKHLSTFQNYDVIKIYYDNGQIALGKMISKTFKATLNNIVVKKVKPSEFRLFQVADFVCTLKLLEIKANNKQLSLSELAFFNYSTIILRKQYFDIIKKKTLN